MSEAVVQSAVRRWRQRHGAMPAFDHDDAAQEARIGLWQAGKNMQKVAYRRIVDAVRDMHPGYRSRQALACVGLDSAAEVTDADPGPEAIVDARMRLARCMRSLSAPEAACASLHLAGFTEREIAAMSGCAPSAAHNRLRRALAKLDRSDAHRAT